MSARPWNQTDDSRLRLQTIVRLRWFAVAGQLIAIAFVWIVLQYELPVGFCMLFVALSAWLNVFLRLRYSSRHRVTANVAAALLSYDVFQLSALLYLTGGIENPFAFLIVAPVTVSAAMLPPRHTIFLGILSVFAAALLVIWHLPLPWRPGEHLTFPTLYKLGLLSSIVAGMVFLALYAWRLSKESRLMQAALSATEVVLAREQRLHALDGLAAAAAHELGTPLATIALVTKELEREVAKGSPMHDDIVLLRGEALRCREILQKLTKRPSEQDPMHASVSVTQLIEEAIEPYRGRHKQIHIESMPRERNGATQHPEPIGERRPGIIFGLGNIMENAVDFARKKVTISAHWDQASVSIVIGDDGPGFTPELLDTLGEPYVTTRPALRHQTGNEDRPTGLGLGFFIAKTLLERSGAEVAVANREPPESGAVVTITWPHDAYVGGTTGTTAFGSLWPLRSVTSDE